MAAAQRPAVRGGVAPRTRGVLLAVAVGAAMLVAACNEDNHPGGTNSTAGTIMFWLRAEWAGNIDNQIQLVHLGGTTFENHVDIFKDYRYLRFLIADNSGFEVGASVDISDWQQGERHMITATWGDNRATLYVDGTPVGVHSYPGEVDVGPDTPVFVGASSGISNFQVYRRTLSAGEVAALFAQPPS